MLVINTKYYTAQLTFDEDLPRLTERMEKMEASPEAWSLLGEILGLLNGVTWRVAELDLKLKEEMKKNESDGSTGLPG